MNNSTNVKPSTYIDLTVETPSGHGTDDIKNNEFSEISSSDLQITLDNNVPKRKRKRKNSLKRKCTVFKNGDDGLESLVISRHTKHTREKFVINISTNRNGSAESIIDLTGSKSRRPDYNRRVCLKNRISRSLSPNISSRYEHCDCCKCLNKRGTLEINDEMKSDQRRILTGRNQNSGLKYVNNPGICKSSESKMPTKEKYRSNDKRGHTKPVARPIEGTNKIAKAEKVKSAPINWKKMDRSTPRCLRHQCLMKGQNSEKNRNSCSLEGISSDDFDISDSDGSSFSLTDIDTLIARTKMRDQTASKQTAKDVDVEEKTLHTRNDDEIECNTIIISPTHSVDTVQLLSETSGTDTPVLIIPCDDETVQSDINSNILRESAKDVNVLIEEAKSDSAPPGILKLVPLQKLLRPEVFDKVSSDKENNDNVVTSQSNNAATSLVPQLGIGQVLLGRYEISEILRNGHYSNLIRACDKQNNNQSVVLKILHKTVPSHVLSNLKIINNTDSLDEHYCVRLIGTVPIKDQLCLLLEDYHSDLRECLNQRADGFDITTVQQLSLQLMMAIQMLRNCNILHADIKPEHILINLTANNIKVTGFDGAINMNREVHRKWPPNPNIQQTLSYMAPEYVMDMTIDYSVDVWSAACVMYEMATGKQLFDASTVEEVLWKIMIVKGEFPNSLKKSKMGMKYFTGIGQFMYQQKKPEIAKEKIPSRNLKTELEMTCMRVDIQTEQEKNYCLSLSHMLANTLHTMLIIEPAWRILVDFALSNPFFQRKPKIA